MAANGTTPPDRWDTHRAAGTAGADEGLAAWEAGILAESVEKRAFLYDDPDSFRAGVAEAIKAMRTIALALAEHPPSSGARPLAREPKRKRSPQSLDRH